MHDRPDLASIQRWVQDVITDPDGVPAGIAAARGRSHFPGAGGVVTASRHLSPEQRLAIYHHDYYGRLLECMRAIYPALQHALGTDLFDQFSLDYLSSYPSTSASLFDLSHDFARHLADTRPQDEAWPDFIIDLARLERAFFVVYDGPGTEGRRIVEPPDLPGELPGSWQTVCLEPSPDLRVFDFSYPVVAYFRAVRRDQQPDLPPPRRTWAALNRRDYVVHVTELTEHQHRVLAALTSGTPVAAALREAGESHHARAWSWTRRWAELGFFASVHPHNGRFETPALDPATTGPVSKGDQS